MAPGCPSLAKFAAESAIVVHEFRMRGRRIAYAMPATINTATDSSVAITSNGGGASSTLAISKTEPDTIMRPPTSFWAPRSRTMRRDCSQPKSGPPAPAFGRTLPIAMKMSATTNVIALIGGTEWPDPASTTID